MQLIRKAWRRLRSNFWTALLVDALAIIAVFIAISSWQTRNLPSDDNTPQLKAVWLDSASADYAMPAGDTGVVYFFAPWCSICRHSIGNLSELVSSGDIAWARVVALDYRNIDEVREFIAETNVTLPVILGDAQTAEDWQIRGYPTYFVIDAEGRIVSRSIGYSTKLGLKARAWLNKS